MLSSPTRCQRSCRSSTFSVLPVLRSINACVNSERCVAVGMYYRNHTYFQILPRTPLNGQSPQEVPVMFTNDSSTARRFASKDYGCTPEMGQRRPSMCVVSVTTFSRPPLIKPTGVLPGGCRVELFGTSKHPPPPGYHCHPFQFIYVWMTGRELIATYFRFSTR